MRRREVWLLGGLFLVALMLRLARLGTFAYFSGDEELVGFVLRRMSIGQRPTLTFPLATLDLSLGPFFSWLTLPFYWFVGNQYQYLFILGAGLGAVTAAGLYLVAGKIWGRRVGVLAALFYAGSFFIIIFDQRYWPHSLNPLLSLLSLWALYQLVRGRYRWAWLLATAVMFGWHSDPAVLALSAAAIISWVWFRLPIKRKEYRLAAVILLTSLLPLVVFDLRHQFINLRRVAVLLERPATKPVLTLEGHRPAVQVLLTGMSHVFYTPVTERAELHFCYCHSVNGWTVGSLTTALLIGAAFLSLAIRAGRQRKPEDILLVIQLISIIGGIFIYHWVFGGLVFQHYLTGVFPGLVITLALLVARLPVRAASWLMAIWLAVNFWSYGFSQAGTTLKDKLAINRWIVDQAEGQPYELRVKGKGLVEGGGWTYLLAELGDQPEISYMDPVLSWLYLDPPASETPAMLALIADRGELVALGDELIAKKSFSGFDLYFSSRGR